MLFMQLGVFWETKALLTCFMDDDVTSHVTTSNVFILLIFCLFRRPWLPLFQYDIKVQGSMLRDDVTSHVTIFNRFTPLVSCLFRRLTESNYSKMLYETRRCVIITYITKRNRNYKLWQNTLLYKTFSPLEFFKSRLILPLSTRSHLQQSLWKQGAPHEGVATDTMRKERLFQVHH